jgi:hypothetical protein
MPHDLAATRRVRKGPLPGVATPEPAPRTAGLEPTADAPPSVAPVVGERVVAEIRHEVGNYFHKLYYWADFLTESRSGRAGDVTATQMLEETIRGLEQLLQATLEYVRPMAASPVHMRAREVADGIVRQLTNGLEGRRIVSAVDDAIPAERELSVDPGRLSQLLGSLARRVATATDAATDLDLRVSVEPGDAGATLIVAVSGAPSEAGHTVLADVEWATAENIARLVGGELSLHDAGGRVRIGLTLPLR